LAAKPPTIAEAKVTAQPEVGIRRDRPFASHDVADALRRNANVFCQPVFGQAQGLQKLFFEHLAWRDGEDGTHFNVPLMIVHDLDVGRPRLSPSKADTPLIIDADTHLALAVPLECLEAIARRNFKVIESASDIQLPQFSSCDRLEGREPTNALAAGQALSVAVTERDDHNSNSNA
jgi:hypothetical protein